jgi:hypothetical protein
MAGSGGQRRPGVRGRLPLAEEVDGRGKKRENNTYFFLIRKYAFFIL